MSAFYWLRISNKYGFRLTNRFAQREFFKFFVTKVRTDEFAVIPILLPSKSLVEWTYYKQIVKLDVVIGRV